VLFALLLGRSGASATLYVLDPEPQEHTGECHSHHVLSVEWSRSSDAPWSLRLWDSHNADYWPFGPYPGINIAGDYESPSNGAWEGLGDSEYALYLHCNVSHLTSVTFQVRFVYDLDQGDYLAVGNWARVSRNERIYPFWEWE